MYKADIFILGSTPYAEAEKARRRLDPLGNWPGAPTAYFFSAEDIVLQKLSWFRKSGGVLMKQLEDVKQVLKVQARTIDFEYLHHWAAELGVIDLLCKILADLGMTDSETISPFNFE